MIRRVFSWVFAGWMIFQAGLAPLLGADDPDEVTETDETGGKESRGQFRYLLVRTASASRWYKASPDDLKAAAEQFPDAKLVLAWRIETGDRMPADFRLSEKLVRESAQLGYVEAQFLMGQIEADDAFSPGGLKIGNYRVAEEWWEKAAAQGSARAMFELGDLYNYGKLGWDHLKAVDWYRKAADKGDIRAMRQIGEVYMADRKQLKRDASIAEEWLQKAAGRGDVAAMFYLGQLLFTEARRDEGIKWFRRAAGKGDQRAGQIVELAELIADERLARNAWLAVPNEGHKALARFAVAMRSSTAGSASISTKQTRGYFSEMTHGLDTAPLIRVLIRLHRESAPENIETLKEAYLKLPPDDLVVTDASLCRELADLYWDGSASTPADQQRAVAWYLRSAQRGDVKAMRRIADLWRSGVTGQPDTAEADRWNARAAAVEKLPKASRSK